MATSESFNEMITLAEGLLRSAPDIDAEIDIIKSCASARFAAAFIKRLAVPRP